LRNDRLVKIIKEKNLQPIDDPKSAIPLQKDSYERLEFLGDSIIHCILADYLFNRYEDEQEGFMTRLRTKIENGETLSELANLIGFQEYAIIARNIEQGGGREKNINIF
jgi:dsRNA-specific ribonuclease